MFSLRWNSQFVHASFSWARWASLWQSYGSLCQVIHILGFFSLFFGVTFWRLIFSFDWAIFLCDFHGLITLVWDHAFLKTATFSSLYGLALYRKRSSPISLVKYSEAFSKLFCGCVFFGLVCVNFQLEGLVSVFLQELIISCSFWYLYAVLLVLWSWHNHPDLFCSLWPQLVEYARPN